MRCGAEATDRSGRRVGFAPISAEFRMPGRDCARSDSCKVLVESAARARPRPSITAKLVRSTIEKSWSGKASPTAEAGFDDPKSHRGNEPLSWHKVMNR
jgi:hypothetical protein